MKTSTTLRAATLSIATLAALAGAQAAHAQSIWDVLKSKAPGLASVMQAVVENNSQAPTVVVQPQASAVVSATPAATAAPAPQASPVATPAPAATATTPAPSPASQAGNGLKKGFELMANRRPALEGELPRHGKAQSGVVGELDAGVMSAKEVSLTLADGRVATARLQRVAGGANGSQSWVGTFDDSPGSVLVISKAKGVVTGFASYKDQVLEIAPTGGGRHLMYAVDPAALPRTVDPERTPQGPKTATSGDALSTTSGYGTGAASPDAATGAVQDLLVLYTAASASRYSQATIESMIQSAVQSGNQAYLNSQINVTLNVVGVQQTALTEQSTMDTTLDALQVDSGVAKLRDQLGADIVILVSESSTYCGLANVMTQQSTSFAPYAFGVVYSSCLSNQSLVHEIGHIQGSKHDRSNSSFAGVYPYSYGYRVCNTDGTGFRTVMSYDCGGVPRVLYFSNPNIYYNGYATGIAYETSPSTSADNARSINNTASTVAAFKSSTSSSGGGTSSMPAAPTGMTVQSSNYNQVNTAWVDNATNETGYSVERSSDGVTFAVVASLGAGSTGYSDTAVSSKSTYYYRVRAYNGAGNSEYSSTVSTTTPDAPPPPPAAPGFVSSSNNGNGSATVSWGAVSGATNYEVLRETQDPRKLTWGRATTVATAPSTVSSIVDQSGTGTFRYSVRAKNAGGTSAYTVSGSVTVTSTSSSTSPRGKSGK